MAMRYMAARYTNMTQQWANDVTAPKPMAARQTRAWNHTPALAGVWFYISHTKRAAKAALFVSTALMNEYRQRTCLSTPKQQGTHTNCHAYELAYVRTSIWMSWHAQSQYPTPAGVGYKTLDQNLHEPPLNPPHDTLGTKT
ncbi:hypothetical protein BS47DRAFT_1368868 [Hydnum rufescens UP504]|uniref:Uncharacterized protein n=1 Tax=Hydnum rufescens UP504 TaxID=1448309 RepID=A0A9P6AEE2_9AGAM|nr:hypothetical protein BS47DRAFT_1368868 [Hydnum rufescens UP504]